MYGIDVSRDREEIINSFDKNAPESTFNLLSWAKINHLRSIAPFPRTNKPQKLGANKVLAMEVKS